MYRNVAEMSLAQRVSAFVTEVTASTQHEAKPADRCALAIRAALAESLPRFDPRLERSEGIPKPWLACWPRCDLSDSHGFPLWEREVFLLVANHYEELLSIFSFYARRGLGSGHRFSLSPVARRLSPVARRRSSSWGVARAQTE